MAQYSDAVGQHLYQARFGPAKMDASSRIDEGYSEDTRSQDGADSPMRMDPIGDASLPQSWSSTAGVSHQIMSLSEAERSHFVYNILRTLRTSSIAAIVDRLRPLLHIDPINVLPPEITSEIFSYLSPATLLEASRASRAWRERALDSRLWRQKFSSEGWGLDMKAIRQFEQTYNHRRKALSRRAEPHVEQSRQKKRARADGHDRSETNSSGLHNNQVPPQDIQGWRLQHGEVEADDDRTIPRQVSTNDQEMYDVDATRPGLESCQSESSMSANVDAVSTQEDDEATLMPSTTSINHAEGSFTKLEVEQSLIRYGSSGNPQVNYNHVYKQKRKLEENWESGSYQSFQLPHKDHPEEAHRECVYTLQYCGNYLVSGSRDKTLRKWDLETQRLVGKPLEGHNASVLCLQFDNSENEDMIVSGSSDTDVILWQFSTGQMIRRIARAHDESVLNLKFDSRFLVTCSKDKTIKIWNRQELRPGDRDYPVKGVDGGGTCPAYILDLHGMASPIDIDRHLSAEDKAPLPPYTPIMILESHNAAVNAIHIYEDQLVSASGDRHVHLWNIHTGVRTSVCRGHTKGIACVQYDGKRIVSGSSDNTIRIFDPVTQAEVACLKGHTRLVRTIQSAFGDLPGKRDLLEAEAVESDGKFHEARLAGRIPIPTVRTRERNPGSKDPKDMMAVGAKLPPGGGGSRWGRIVSGSYDETIIIWKKLADGRWVKAHVLRQEEALRAAGGPLLSHSDMANQAHQQALTAARNAPPPPPHLVTQVTQAAQQTYPPNATPEQRGYAWAQQLARLDPQPSAGPSSTRSQNNVTNPPHPFPDNNNQKPSQHPYSASQQSVQQTMAGGSEQPGPTQNPIHPTLAQIRPQQGQQLDNTVAQAQSAVGDMHPPRVLPPNQQQQQQNTHNPPQRQLPPPQQPQQQHQHQHRQQPATHPPTHPAYYRPANPQLSQPNARVFKLQFDARRIICCSQDPKIVGWDFANGDEKIVECSRFFATPQ
ncbi:MAG: hypothetical protein LQ349_006147 [Xanthoria aureola]|nr:MAG: hypothetical protein LQ349_006147 [Xanthoria aureola]